MLLQDGVHGAEGVLQATHKDPALKIDHQCAQSRLPLPLEPTPTRRNLQKFVCGIYFFFFFFSFVYLLVQGFLKPASLPWSTIFA